MPNDAVAAIDAALAHANAAALIGDGADALDHPVANPIEQERRDAAVRAADAVQAEAEAAVHAAEAAASGHLDVVA